MTILPRSFRLALSLPAASAVLVVARLALADVPPPNECATSASIGSACTTAGSGFDQDGVCASATCSSASPPPNGSTYACVLCELPDASASSDATTEGQDAHVVSGDAAPSTPDATTATKDAAPSTKDAATASDASTGAASSSSGCAVSPVGTGPSNGALFGVVALGLAMTAVSRRRRG